MNIDIVQEYENGYYEHEHVDHHNEDYFNEEYDDSSHIQSLGAGKGMYMGAYYGGKANGEQWSSK